MEGLKQELLWRKEEANVTLKKKDTKLASAVTLDESAKEQVKDMVRDYIKTRLQHVERYVDNRIEYKKNGGHASLKVNNTSPAET
jgi:hypothetical protein